MNPATLPPCWKYGSFGSAGYSLSCISYADNDQSSFSLQDKDSSTVNAIATISDGRR